MYLNLYYYTPNYYYYSPNYDNYYNYDDRKAERPEAVKQGLVVSIKDWPPNTQRSRRRGKRRLAHQPGLACVFYLVSCPATGTAAQHFPNQIRVRPDAPDASTESAPVPL